MTLPNKLTFLRLILSPIFILFFFIDSYVPIPSIVSVIVLIVVFAAIELTDLLDGMLARKLNQTSELGKVLDPFADSLSRLTYFLCFAFAGIMPIWIFVLVLYRDLGVSFIRLLMAKNGVVMPARLSGKVKAVVYAAAGAGGVLFYFFLKSGFLPEIIIPLRMVVTILLYAAGAIAVWSLIDYASVLKNRKD